MEVGSYLSWYGVLKVVELTFIWWEEREDLRVEVFFSSEEPDRVKSLV